MVLEHGCSRQANLPGMNWHISMTGQTSFSFSNHQGNSWVRVRHRTPEHLGATRDTVPSVSKPLTGMVGKRAL